MGENVQIDPAISIPSTKVISFRSIILGFLVILINVYWVTIVEVRWDSLDGSCLPIFVTPVFILLIFSLFNRFFSLSSAELIAIYVMSSIAETLAGHDMFQNLFGVMNHAFWFASPENRWKELFWDYIPTWLSVTDRSVLAGFYMGGVSPYSWLILREWLLPLSSWGIFTALLGFWMFCFVVIVRKQWQENEKLTYPTVQLVTDLVGSETRKSLFLKPTFLFGFGLASLIDLMNGLHQIYPFIPPFSRYIKSVDIRSLFTERPWNSIDPFRIAMYPFSIGLFYFLPLDLSFSCWFFSLLRKFLQVIGSLFGWDQVQGFPFFIQQGYGAWIMLAFLAIWGSRQWLAETLKKTHKSEPLNFRWTWLGLFTSSLLLISFTYAMGMKPLMLFVFWTSFFSVSIAITRVRAELGAPHSLFGFDPRNIAVELFGTERFSPRELAAISLTRWFNRGYRCLPMPMMLEAFKFAQNLKIHTKEISQLMLISYLIAIPIVFWSNLHICYKEGAKAKCLGFKSWVGEEAFNWLASQLQTPQKPNNLSRGAALIGAGITWLLWNLRREYLLPFHHAGYALAVGGALTSFWLPFLISWAIKSLILKFGGIKSYHRIKPFFIGLLVGDFCAGSLWAIVGPVRGFQNYRIYWH